MGQEWFSVTPAVSALRNWHTRIPRMYGTGEGLGPTGRPHRDDFQLLDGGLHGYTGDNIPRAGRRNRFLTPRTDFRSEAMSAEATSIRR